MKDKTVRTRAPYRVDVVTIVLVTALVLFGLITLLNVLSDPFDGTETTLAAFGDRLNYQFFSRQIGNILISLVILIPLAVFDYEKYKPFTKAAYIVCLILLALLVLAGESTRGALGWYWIGTRAFQPSEITKVVLILVLSTKQLASTTVAEFREGATSSSYGLEIGDRVLRVNGVRVHTGNELVYEIMNKGYAPVDLLVERDGEKVLVEGVVFPGLSEQGIAFGQPDFRVYAESRTFGHLLSHTYFRSVSTVKMIYDQLFDLLRGRFGLNAVSGPIGITEEMGNAARSGFPNFLYLLTVITVNLGVFNLLPLPALDGGRLFFLIFEAVARRPINRKVEGYIHLAGLALLMLLMIVVACKDVVGLIRK